MLKQIKVQIFFLLSICHVVSAGTISVSTTGDDLLLCGETTMPCKTIQYALDKAASGDTINVAMGTYLENLSVETDSGNITYGPVTIQCGWSSDFSFRSTSAQSTVIDGGDNGTAATFLVNVGVLQSATVNVDGCTLKNGYHGIRLRNIGGIINSTLSNNRISNNSHDGVSIYTSQSGSNSTTLSGCVIANNEHGITADRSGTGSQLADFTLTLSGNEIENNFMGGVYVDAYADGKITMDSQNNLIVNNCTQPSLDPVVEITSRSSGAEIQATMTNDTVTGNFCQGINGGIYLRADESSTIDLDIINSIVWGNYGGGATNDLFAWARPDPGYVSTADINARYSDVGVVQTVYNGTYTPGTGMVNVDPKTEHDGHLSENSPVRGLAQCGSNIIVYQRVAPYDDIDGEDRPGWGSLLGCDMGADQFYPSIFCFPLNGQGGKLGIICM